MPRFVILEHDHPTLHWDLMLEADGVLRTWRLARPPTRIGDVIALEPLGDHRLRYLDYEGPVSEGRGFVRRWDAGEYAVETSDESALTFRLDGQRVRGRFRLDGDETRVLHWLSAG